MIAEVDGARLRVMGNHELLAHQPVADRRADDEVERLARLAQDESQRQS